jgi:uncharacterized protein
MNRRFRPLCATLALLIGAGCASAPVRFHTLVAPAATAAPVEADYAIALLPVSVPPQVDVPQIVLRTGDSALTLAESEQWAAPLGDELRGALAARIAARLGVTDVSRLRIAGARPVYRIRVDVQRFESVYGRRAVLEAGWSIHKPGEETPALICASRLEVAVARGYAALVQGHQLALDRLAADIAAALAPDHGTPQPARCPSTLAGQP